MGLLDFLRRKRPVASGENLVRLQSADTALRQAGLRFSGKAGLCFRASNDCRATIQGLENYPRGSGITARCSSVEDSYGCVWILLEEGLDKVVESAAAIFAAISGSACGREYLCAAFAYDAAGKKVYWIYNLYGKFYPFVPAGQERDNELELGLKRELSDNLPIEGDLSQWYPLWDLPL